MSINISINDLGFAVESEKVGQHDRFWSKVNRGAWEVDTYRVIDAHTDAQTLAIDCGAWIGPTVLYTAQRAGLCVGFEPDPVAYETLMNNIKLNASALWAKKLKVLNEAIHSSGKPIQIAAAGNGGDSMTSALNVEHATAWTVKTRKLQDVIKAYRASFKKVFVKIDVEGGEYDILPGIKDVMADTRNSFLISFHHRRLKLALEHDCATKAEAHEKLVATVSRVVDALPWERGIRTIEGELLERAAVEQIVAKGKGFAMDIVIG